MRLTLAILAVALLAGCSQPTFEDSEANNQELFSPTKMRIHPVFTQFKDLSGDGKNDSIEVVLEFQDQFGDPTKAAGTVRFEVYQYRQAEPDPRGLRMLNPFYGSLQTTQEQMARWNRTSRTYTFQLACGLDMNKPYVLTAMFRAENGQRFFDRVVLQAPEEPVGPTTKPTTRPAIAAQP